MSTTRMMSKGRFPCMASANPVARWRGPSTRGFGWRQKHLVFPASSVLPSSRQPVVCHAVEPISDAEQQANDMRWRESGNQGSADEWSWTLNWDEVLDNVVVGSCPRKPEDLDTIVDGAKATALLSLQSDICLEAMCIDGEGIRARGGEKGVAMIRIPIRDFDHGDQTLMLPEAVRTLAMLLAAGHRVYVHCTAGINRATLTVLGYLTFVQGHELHSAVRLIKSRRPQAHPYIDCWKSTKARLLQGRKDEVVALARSLAKESTSNEGDSFADWVEAENRLIRETFQRQLACSLAVVSQMAVSRAASVSSACTMPEELDKTRKDISTVKKQVDEEREEKSESGSCHATLAELAEAHEEIAALRQGLMDIAETSERALRDMPPNTSSSTNHQNRAENPMSDIGPTTSL